MHPLIEWTAAALIVIAAFFLLMAIGTRMVVDAITDLGRML